MCVPSLPPLQNALFLSGVFPIDRNSSRRALSPAQRLSQGLRPVTAMSSSGPPSHKVLDVHASLSTRPAGALTGTWKKDWEASDPMDAACDLVELPWLLRKALRVLSTLKVEENEEHFKTTIKAGGIMDVVERYPFSEEYVKHGRRDKRRGQHTGRVVGTDRGPCIE
jgi:hypothetical protein